METPSESRLVLSEVEGHGGCSISILSRTSLNGERTRPHRGMTQADHAKETGTSLVYFFQTECGERRCLAAHAEQLAKEFSRSPLAFLGENDRLCLADRIGDKALLVKSVHCVPVERLPGPAEIMPPQIEQRQDSFVDTIGVDILHGTPAGQMSPQSAQDYHNARTRPTRPGGLAGCLPRNRAHAVTQTWSYADTMRNSRRLRCGIEKYRAPYLPFVGVVAA